MGDETEVDETAYFFTVQDSDKGMDIGFKKDTPKVIATLMQIGEAINDSLDNSFDTVGELFRSLGDVHDSYSEQIKEREEADNG